MNAQLASLDPMEGCLRPLHVSPLTSSGPRRGVVAVFSSSKGQQRASRTRPPVHPRVVAQFGTISVRTTGVQHDEHQRAPTNAYDEATHRSPICSFIRENADERRPAPTAVGALITRRSQVQILPPPPSKEPGQRPLRSGGRASDLLMGPDSYNSCTTIALRDGTRRSGHSCCRLTSHGEWWVVLDGGVT